MKNLLKIVNATIMIFVSFATAENVLLNVSYDPTRELYQSVNRAFAKQYEQKNGKKLIVNMSHGGSGKQARAVIDGLDADIVTLALAYDIDEIAKKSGFISQDWQKRLPHNSTPFSSTIVFVVRKGNPKKIKDWDDLIKNNVAVITPNPKTSGGARWNYLAAWGFALNKYGSEEKAMEFVQKLYQNVPVLDAGARASTTTFVQRGIGDVLLAWENEAYLSLNALGKEKIEIIIPSISILAEPPVAIVDKVAERHGTTKLAKEYLDFLYTSEGQEIGSQNYYRPQLKDVLEKHKSVFASVKLFTIDQMFGGWKKAQAVHFSDGGTFDHIYQLDQ